MKIVKRVIPFALVLALCFTMFGCDKSSKQVNSAETTVNWKGRTMILHSWIAPDTNMSDNDKIIFSPMFEAVDNFNKEKGSDIKIVGDAGNTAAMQAASAAGEGWDLVYNYGFFPTQCALGLIQPIDKYIDKTDTALWDKQFVDAHTWQGKIWALSGSKLTEFSVLQYDLTAFQQYGVKTPTEYLKEGKWDWDAFRTCAKQMTKDTDGDGKTDLFGVSNVGLYKRICENAIVANADGTIKPNLDSKYNQQAFQMLFDMINTDKSVNMDKTITTFDSNKSAMYAAYQRFIPMLKGDGTGIQDITVSKSGHQLRFVPIPKRPGDSNYQVQLEYKAFYVPVGAKNPKASVELGAYICKYWQNKISSMPMSQEEKDVRNIIASQKIAENGNYVGVTGLPNSAKDNNKYINIFTTPVSTALAAFTPINKSECDVYNKTYVPKSTSSSSSGSK